MIKPVKKLEGVYKETEELITIIAKSIITTKRTMTSNAQLNIEY